MGVCVCVSSCVAGVAHRLHSKHGKNVVVLGDGCQGVRVGGYAHGIVFSAKELKADELFEVSEASRLLFPMKHSKKVTRHRPCLKIMHTLLNTYV